MRLHNYCLRVFPLLVGGIFLHGTNALAEDDLKTATAESTRKFQWKLDSSLETIDDAIQQLGAIASAESLILGTSSEPSITIRFSHPTLIDDYIEFTREHEHAEDASRMQAQLESVKNTLAKLKEGLAGRYLEPAEVERELNDTELPNMRHLAAREHVAGELVARAKAIADDEITATGTIEQAVEERILERLHLAQLNQQLEDGTSSTHFLTDAECRTLANDPEVLALLEPMVTPAGKEARNWHLNLAGAWYYDEAQFNKWMESNFVRHFNDHAVSEALKRGEKCGKLGLSYWDLFRIIVQYRRDLFLTATEQLTFLGKEKQKPRPNKLLLRKLAAAPMGPPLPEPNTPPHIERAKH